MKKDMTTIGLPGKSASFDFIFGWERNLVETEDHGANLENFVPISGKNSLKANNDFLWGNIVRFIHLFFVQRRISI